jgi:hypothetical protein
MFAAVLATHRDSTRKSLRRIKGSRRCRKIHEPNDGQVALHAACLDRGEWSDGCSLIDKYALARRRKELRMGRTPVELHKPAFRPWSARSVRGLAHQSLKHPGVRSTKCQRSSSKLNAATTICRLTFSTVSVSSRLRWTFDAHNAMM